MPRADGPYLRQTEYSISDTAEQAWLSAARAYLSTLAAQAQGLWSVRLYQQRPDVRTYYLIAVWGNRKEFDRAISVAALGSATSATDGVVTSPVVREYELIDHVWGRKGITNFLHPGRGFAQQVLTHVTAENLESWTPYRRNFASVMARQDGVASYEIARDLHDPTLFLVLRTYENESYAAVMPGATTPYRPTKEVEYATRPATDLGLYAGARAAVFTDCELVDGALGESAAQAYTSFMEDLSPA